MAAIAQDIRRYGVRNKIELTVWEYRVRKKGLSEGFQRAHELELDTQTLATYRRRDSPADQSPLPLQSLYAPLHAQVILHL